MMCAWCDEPVSVDEYEDGPLRDLPLANFHLECNVRAVVGSAAHQLHECHCYGGTREDPPGMSKRDAAKLAFETWHQLHLQNAKA